MTEEARARRGDDDVLDKGDAATTSWGQYVRLLRELDSIRTEEQARSATSRETATGMTARLDRLDERLQEQGERLFGLARRLRLRRPTLTPKRISGRIGLEQAVERAGATAERAAAVADIAERRGRQPALLPRWQPVPRNFVIYMFWACLALVPQYLLFATSGPDGPPFLEVFGIVPLAALLVGVLTVRALGRSRIPPDPPKRAARQRPLPQPLSVRLGVLVCWCTGMIVFLVVAFHGELGL